MKSWPRQALATIATCTLLLTGCSEGEIQKGPVDKKVKADMNMQEAAERADAMLDTVFSGIKPQVQWAHGQTTTGSCDLSRRRTVMTAISKERRGSFLGVVERIWRNQGYRITDVDKSEKFPAIFAKTPDGFGISLTIGGEGQAFFEVATPCVTESKVADPTSKPNGPAYEGVYPLPRPNVQSKFWSSVDPVS